MIVSDLQKHLGDLSDFLERSGGTKVAQDLQALQQGLQPFAGRTVRDFVAFLTKADEFDRTGSLKGSGGGTSRAKKVAGPPPEEIQRQVKEVYDRAADPSLTAEEVERVLGQLDALTVPQLQALSQALGSTQKAKKKKGELVDLIRKTVTNARTLSQRTEIS